MRTLGISFSIKVPREKLITILATNRENHAKLCAEARVTYIEKARSVLLEKLDQLQSGKAIALAASLRVPIDYTDAYDTAIAMLKLHMGESVEINASEYQHFVEDKWDWTDMWVGTNASYSSSTRAYGASKGVEI